MLPGDGIPLSRRVPPDAAAAPARGPDLPRPAQPNSHEGKTTAAWAQRAKVGDPLDPATTIGPLASRSEFSKVTEYVRIGREEDRAALVIGGGTPKFNGKGYFVEPTVFAPATNAMRISREEIFGPVLGVIPALTAVQLAVVDAALSAGPTANGFAAETWSLERAAAVIEAVIEAVTGARCSRYTTRMVLRDHLGWEPRSTFWWEPRWDARPVLVARRRSGQTCLPHTLVTPTSTTGVTVARPPEHRSDPPHLRAPRAQLMGACAHGARPGVPGQRGSEPRRRATRRALPC